MKKILHISNDDQYIIHGKKIFDYVPEVENTFWIIPDEGKSSKCDSFVHKDLTDINLNSTRYIEQMNSFDLICIHFLNIKLYPLLQSKKLKPPILWIGWGGDYYWMLDTYHDFNLLLPKTRRWLAKLNLSSSFEPMIKWIKKTKRASKLKAINQITYFAPIYKTEYDLIKKNYPNFQPKFIEWNYGYLNQEVIDYYVPLARHGNCVMIGNSATPTNNHMDIFDDLSAILKEHNIILPLNYGSSKYKKFIAKIAKNSFGDQVEILDTFISSKDFDKKLMECQNLIIGSYRQQAVGTIITAFYLGLNVFLYQESFNYHFFKENNFHVYSIEELKLNPLLLELKTTAEQIQENRTIINKCWSIEKNASNITELLHSLSIV